MRVALIQLLLHGESQAQDLQHVSAAIDRAASMSPPPDLIALPGHCDVADARSARGVTDAMLACARENVASKAKEWGVFIAAGLHTHAGGKLVPYAILLDSDGDTVARSGGAFAGTSPISVWSSPMGVLGVLDPASPPSGKDAPVGLQDGALVVLPLAARVKKTRRRALDGFVSALCDNASVAGEVFAAIVSPAGDAADSAGAPVTLLRGRGARPLACVADGLEATAIAEIVLTRSDAG